MPAGRRGDFRCQGTGYSQGQGHQIPTNLQEKRIAVQDMLDDFMNDPDVRGYLNYADGEYSQLPKPIFFLHTSEANILISATP